MKKFGFALSMAVAALMAGNTGSSGPVPDASFRNPQTIRRAPALPGRRVQVSKETLAKQRTHKDKNFGTHRGNYWTARSRFNALRRGRVGVNPNWTHE
jgi:hypothetical protein